MCPANSLDGVDSMTTWDPDITPHATRGTSATMPDRKTLVRAAKSYTTLGWGGLCRV